ncbi:hypothetical protein ACOBQB_05715 [Streptomyces sp. G5(2025)]|uniref:hypothetical protein n=1 Tax=Streptomyces sp. G5(2025) TaxID=3406628 RepID=UPI003C1BEA1D
MLSSTARRYLLSGPLIAALLAFGYYAAQPVPAGCTLSSEPYGSQFEARDMQASGGGQCEGRARFMAWLRK